MLTVKSHNQNSKYQYHIRTGILVVVHIAYNVNM